MPQALSALFRFLQITCYLLTALLLVLFVAILGSRMVVNDQLRVTVEQVASEAAGVAITVGRVRGAWWSGLSLDDVVVHETPDPESGALITAPLVQVDYSLLSFFGAMPRPIRVDAYRPRLSAVMRKDHLLNFLPRGIPPHEQAPMAPSPPVDLVFHNGAVSYTDEGARKPFTAEVANVSGSGRLRGFDLTLELQALRDADLIKAHVAYDLKGQQGEVRAQASGLSLPYFLDRFAYAPEWSLTAGKADLDVTVAWQDPMIMDELTLRGTARVYGGEARLMNVAAPVKDLAGFVAFNQDVALVQDVRATIGGMPLRAEGQVHTLVKPVPALGLPDPRLALTVTAPAVDLAKFPTLFPGLTHWPVVGVGELIAEVRGTSLDPRIALAGKVPRGAYGPEAVTDLTLAASYRHGAFDIDRFDGRLAGGQASGSVGWTFPDDPKAEVPYRVAASFGGLDLAGLLARHLEEPSPLAAEGRLSGTYALSGVGDRAESRLAVKVDEGRLEGMPVAHFETEYHYATPRWEIPALTLSLGQTQLTARAEGRDGGAFKLSFSAPRAELAQLARLAKNPLPVAVSGEGAIEGSLRGLAGRPATWTGSATASVPRAFVDAQPVEGATLALSVADNRLCLDRATARLWGGALATTGTLWPFMGQVRGEEPLAHARYDVRARGLELARVAGLPAEWGAIAGRADASAALTVEGEAVTADGTASVAALRHGRWGGLEAVKADFAYAPDRLTLKPLVWRQGKERVSATGDVLLGDEPRLDLRVVGRDAEVQTLLGAVNWPEVVAALNPRAAAQRRALGPETFLGGLPEAIADARWTLAEGLGHWGAYRKVPLDRPPPAPPVLPFWEGTRGRLSFDLRLAGAAASPAISLNAEAEQLHLFDRLLDSAYLDMQLADGRLVLPSFRLREAGHTVLTAGGALGDRPEDTLVVRTHGLDLGWTDRFLRAHKVKLAGTADMRLAIRGPAADPRLEASGELRQGRLEGPDFEPVPFDRVQADVAYERDMVSIRQARLTHRGHEATVGGRLPVGDSERARLAPLDLAVRLEDEHLAIVNLFDQGRFEWLGGLGRVELKLGGTLGKPSLGGRIQLREGRVKLDGLDTPVEQLTADVELDDRQIMVKALKGRYGGGDVSVFGDVSWQDLKPDRLNLTALARPFRLRTPEGLYDGMVEANLRLTGTVAQPALGGLVALWDGTVALKNEAAQPGEASAPPPWRLNNLNVSLGPNMRIKNDMIDLIATTQQRQGYLRVDGPFSAPKPRGVVIIESGTIRPLNNAFKIVEGRVEFLGESVGSQDDMLGILEEAAAQGGETTMNALLDIQAQTVVYDYSADEHVNVWATVAGSMQQMEMRFRSEPIRSEQEILDILSKKQVLAGTFSGRLDGGQVIMKEVGGLVTSNIEELVSPYTLFLRDRLNLHTLRFELVADYQNNNVNAIAGFKPALVLETRPMWERLSLGTRLVAGEMYDTTPTVRGDNTYFAFSFRLNRRLGMEYKLEPYIDLANQRTLNHWLGLRAQYTY